MGTTSYVRGMCARAWQGRDKKRLELEDRYEQLAKEGTLEKALAKKRRKNAAKDHKWLPRSRRVTAEAEEAA
jgi:hypothetical protein